MKKTYMTPEMETVDILLQQSLLAGSLEINTEETVDDPTELLAPSLKPDLGLPAFIEW